MRALALALVLVTLACGQHGSHDSADMSPQLPARDPRCPDAPPADSTPCDDSLGVFECEYGGDPLARNTVAAFCEGAPARWQVIDPFNAVGPNPAACAATFADAQTSGSCAADVNLACDYDEGRCGCVCNDTTVSWACRLRSDVYRDGPDGGTPCPTTRPLSGDACGAEDVFCYYDQVCGTWPLSFGPPMRCFAGYWQTTVDTGAACAPLNCAGWNRR